MPTMTTKPKLLYFVEVMRRGAFTYIVIVDLVNSLIDDWDVYIGYAVRGQTPQNYKVRMVLVEEVKAISL